MIWRFRRKEWLQDLQDKNIWREVTFQVNLNTLTRSIYAYAIYMKEI